MSGRRRHLFFGIFLIFSFLQQEAIGFELKPIRIVTENGITLLIVEQPSLPIVSVEALVRAGAIHDPNQRAGLANITATLLDEGTTGRTAVEISDAVDAIGARLSTRARYDYMTAGLRVLKRDVDTGFDLLSDILINPRFDPKEVARIRTNLIGEILAEKDQPRAIARRAFRKMIFGNHPYHHPVNGFEETLQSVEQNDLVSFHRRYYRPNNTILSIVGDVTRQEAEALVQKYFGKWERKAVSFPKIEPPKPLQSKEVRKIDKDLTQATIILGHVGLNRANPDYYSALVMNYILGGGGFSSRMMSEIRDNQGLVYSIYSRFSANRDPGPFAVTLQTENSNTLKAIEGVLQEINRIQRKGVTEKEISEAKAYLMGSFPLRIDTTRKVASLLPQIEFHRLGLDYLKEYTEYIDRVTLEDVHRVARKYLHSDRYALVVVGRQREITGGN